MVLLGDLVVLSSGVGQVQHYLIVHPLEAGFDPGRISCDSPLGAAVLGQSVGQRVVVPGTGKQVTILAATRKQTPT
ncbi:MAG TPA: GreA/GreB family elongation factor [Actinomycetota bacterium]|nr:GreA/GreB family elongation factor [Actinomycetota bacterium]